MTEQSNKYVIAVGNVIYGNTFIGPFVDADEAIEWANEDGAYYLEKQTDSWVLIEIKPPKEFEG